MQETQEEFEGMYRKAVADVEEARVSERVLTYCKIQLSNTNLHFLGLSECSPHLLIFHPETTLKPIVVPLVKGWAHLELPGSRAKRASRPESKVPASFGLCHRVVEGCCALACAYTAWPWPCTSSQ